MLLRLLTEFGYVALAGLLVAGGLGVPIPEELIQLMAGVLARAGLLAFVPALAATYGGIVAGDILLFRLAQRHGEGLLTSLRAARLLTPRRRDALERHFARHAFLTIVVARHLSGFRVVVYVLAATHQVRARTFILADALSALLSVPLVVSLGYLFAGQLEEVKKRVHEAQLLAAAGAILALVAYLVVRRLRKARRPPPA
ncbi:MAG TPA: DedA family protein [Anaeromyxobacteraceae bacterium]|nr:DedA family protein [Anaeromyxobacteraceae bacterium]